MDKVKFPAAKNVYGLNEIDSCVVSLVEKVNEIIDAVNRLEKMAETTAAKYWGDSEIDKVHKFQKDQFENQRSVADDIRMHGILVKRNENLIKEIEQLKVENKTLNGLLGTYICENKALRDANTALSLTCREAGAK